MSWENSHTYESLHQTASGQRGPYHTAILLFIIKSIIYITVRLCINITTRLYGAKDTKLQRPRVHFSLRDTLRSIFDVFNIEVLV